MAPKAETPPVPRQRKPPVPAKPAAAAEAPPKPAQARKPAAKARIPAAGVPDRMVMVAEAAYYLAQRRGFRPGGELEDWLAAEAEIDLLLARR